VEWYYYVVYFSSRVLWRFDRDGDQRPARAYNMFVVQPLHSAFLSLWVSELLCVLIQLAILCSQDHYKQRNPRNSVTARLVPPAGALSVETGECMFTFARVNGSYKLILGYH